MIKDIRILQACRSAGFFRNMSVLAGENEEDNKR